MKLLPCCLALKQYVYVQVCCNVLLFLSTFHSIYPCSGSNIQQIGRRIDIAIVNHLTCQMTLKRSGRIVLAAASICERSTVAKRNLRTFKLIINSWWK
ncbi:hypothetical protein BJ742DRAFT_826112 [Cladochytrium replicatum]|nr:hypothetical protein BJ742DRAFT_826112 [Cladochytrium replicatum]